MLYYIIHCAPRPHSYTLSQKKYLSLCYYPTKGKESLRGKDKAYFMFSPTFPLSLGESVGDGGKTPTLKV